MTTKKQGFTLIELSIVLVIIGLIVGGVLVGRDLINAAKWKRVHSQLVEYETAAMTFRLKYGKIPGDINNADLFFGTYCQKSGLPNVSCNGNGNGLISTEGLLEGNPTYLAGYGLGAAPNWEYATFWRHLYFAGLMTQELTGELMHASTVVMGRNTPTTEFGMGLAVAGKAFFVGNFPISSNPVVGQTPGRARVTPVWTKMDNYMFDTKFDDGAPQTGKIKVVGTTIGGTYTHQCQSLANNTYTANTSAGCVIVYEWIK